MEVEPSQYQCDECDFFTHSYGYYKTHRRVRHNDEGVIYRCDLCLQTFNFPDGLRVHKEELHETKILFYCNYCNHISNSARNLNRHEKRHINPEKRTEQKSCPYCSKIVSNRQFAHHLEKAHGIRKDADFTFKCDVCPYKAETEVVLKKHVVVKHAPVQLSCRLCKFKTPFEVKLSIHLVQQHTEVKCDQCSYSSTSKAELKYHKDSKHDGYLSCEKCPFRASNMWTMGKHRWGKHAEKLFCYICQYEAESLPDLLEHALQEHKMKTYCCSECDFITGKKSNFTSHLSKKHNIANTREIYNCNTCEFQAVGKRSFNNHMKSHKLEEKDPKLLINCQHCDFKAMSKRTLNKHIKSVHKKETDPKLLQCPKCDFQIQEKRSLKKHLKSHKEKVRDPIKCFKCDFKAERKSELRLHMKDSHFYKCEQCKYKTQNSSRLEKHKKKHHGEERPSKNQKNKSEVGGHILSDIDSIIESMKMEKGNQEYFEPDEEVTKVKIERVKEEPQASSYVCPISSCVFLSSVLTEKIISDHFTTNHPDLDSKDWNFLPLI